MSFEDDMRAAGEHLMNSQDTGVRNEGKRRNDAKIRGEMVPNLM